MKLSQALLPMTPRVASEQWLRPGATLANKPDRQKRKDDHCKRHAMGDVDHHRAIGKRSLHKVVKEVGPKPFCSPIECAVLIVACVEQIVGTFQRIAIDPIKEGNAGNG